MDSSGSATATDNATREERPATEVFVDISDQTTSHLSVATTAAEETFSESHRTFDLSENVPQIAETELVVACVVDDVEVLSVDAVAVIEATKIPNEPNKPDDPNKPENFRCRVYFNIGIITLLILSAFIVGATLWHKSNATSVTGVVDSGCISTYNELAQAAGDTTLEIIAICAGASINVVNEINVYRDNVTVCCANPSEGGCDIHSSCALQSERAHQLLHVQADSITLEGVTFRVGKTRGTWEGNVNVFGGGNHLIRNCVFEGGAKRDDTGGNLKIVGTNQTNVTVTNCTFKDGYAEIGGGGLLIENTFEVGILNSSFVENRAGYGGGFAVLDSHKLDVRGSSFQENHVLGKGAGGWWSLERGFDVRENSGLMNNASVCSEFFCSVARTCVYFNGTFGEFIPETDSNQT